jgi:hypothetical protein
VIHGIVTLKKIAGFCDTNQQRENPFLHGVNVNGGIIMAAVEADFAALADRELGGALIVAKGF